MPPTRPRPHRLLPAAVLGALLLLIGTQTTAPANPASPASPAAAKPKPTTTTSTSTTTTTTVPPACPPNCLDPTDLIQVASGNTGGNRVTEFTFGFNNPVRANTTALLFVATDITIDAPRIPTSGTDSDWIDLWESFTAFNQPNAPYIYVLAAGSNSLVMPNWGGGTSWTAGDQVPFSAPVAASWLAVEVAGLAPFNTAPDNFVRATSFDTSGTATALDTTNSGSTNTNVDEILFSVFASRVGGGAPPSVSSVANTTVQPGTWTPLGNSETTTNAAGANVRLNVFRKFTGGQVSVWDATASYNGPSFLTALVGALHA